MDQTTAAWYFSDSDISHSCAPSTRASGYELQFACKGPTASDKGGDAQSAANPGGGGGGIIPECISQILHSEVSVIEIILHQSTILVHSKESKPRETIPSTIQAISAMICQTLGDRLLNNLPYIYDLSCIVEEINAALLFKVHYRGANIQRARINSAKPICLRYKGNTRCVTSDIDTARELILNKNRLGDGGFSQIDTFSAKIVLKKPLDENFKSILRQDRLVYYLYRKIARFPVIFDLPHKEVPQTAVMTN